MSLQRAFLFLVVFALTASVYAQDPPPPPAEDVSSPAPTVSTVLPTKMVSGGRGSPILIDFRKLFPDVPPMVAVIYQAPTGGSLYKSDGKTLIDSQKMSTQNNRMIYMSRDDFPANSESQAKDRVLFRLQTDEGSYKGEIEILVNNRGLEVHDYNLRVVESNAKPMLLTLNVRDGKQKLTLKSPVLSEVTIATTPKGGCSVQQFDKTAITESGTKLTDQQLRIWIVPDQDMEMGAKCEFTFSALRRNGVRSRAATITLTRTTARAPRAYATRVTYQVDFDTSRNVELIGMTGNTGRNLTFILTSIPTIGQLFDVTETTNDELPTKGITKADLPLKLYTGPKTRVVLVYKIMNPERLKEQTLKAQTVEFSVMDGLQTSGSGRVFINLVRKASPMCGNIKVSPVFWDRPVKNLILNFTTPNGLRVQRLVLMSAPKNPIGDITYLRKVMGRQDERKAVQVGGYFSDRNKRLQYLVRRANMRSSGNETYTFRVQTFNGLSCIGTVTFEVLQHNARRPLPGAQGGFVRRELVRSNSITLLPMWGQANMTTSTPQSIRILTVPSMGTINRVSSQTKYEPGLMYRVNRRGDQLSYCRRNNCEKLLDGVLSVGDVVNIQELFAANSLKSDSRIWVFYKSQVISNLRLKDTFSYVFVGKDGSESKEQRVEIYFRAAAKRVIDISYSMSDVRRNANFDRQAETLIICKLSNLTNQRVMIPEFDKYRRHGQKEEFRMFQYRKDGNRIYNGDRLANASVGGITGQWLAAENTVIVIPSVRARQQKFRFRAVIYNTSEDGQLLRNTREEVRVVVTRENSVPTWVYEYITGRGSASAYVGSMASIDIAAFDDDDDLLSFRVRDGVKLGSLFYEKEAFGVRTLEQVKGGSLIRLPKGSFQRSEIRMQYLTHGAPDWTFPRWDNFSLYADDGGGVLSELLFFNISIVGDQSGRVQVTEYNISLGFVAIAALIAFGTVVTMIMVIRRRMSSSKRYVSVPQQDNTELN